MYVHVSVAMLDFKCCRHAVPFLKLNLKVLVELETASCLLLLCGHCLFVSVLMFLRC